MTQERTKQELEVTYGMTYVTNVHSSSNNIRWGSLGFPQACPNENDSKEAIQMSKLCFNKSRILDSHLTAGSVSLGQRRYCTTIILSARVKTTPYLIRTVSLVTRTLSWLLKHQFTCPQPYTHEFRNYCPISLTVFHQNPLKTMSTRSVNTQ